MLAASSSPGGDVHIGARLAELAQSHPDRSAIVDDAGTWTFQRFHQRITRFGNAMHGLGLAKGDRIALLLPDCREYLEADYGAMAAGFVRVPMDPRLTRPELVALLQCAGVRALVTHTTFSDKLDKLADDVATLQSIVFVGKGAVLDYETLLAKSSEQALSIGDGEDLATLNFSGGTTGAPKAVMLRHRNLMTVAANTIQGFDIKSDAVFLNVRPLWPIAQVILMSHLFAGATVMLGGRFDADRLAAMIDESGATRTSLVPTQLVRWIEHLKSSDRMPKLEAIYVGGSRIPSAVFEHALDLLGPRIGVLYGMTEAPICSYLQPQELAGEERSRLMESVGRPLPAYRVRLAGVEENAVDASGEILVQGDNVMAGYWRNEDATYQALRDGWLHTGDIGAFGGDGHLSIVGRLKEVIRSGSSSIMPKEVEDVIAAHPAVGEVAVLGLPDTEWGEAVTAFVVLKSGMSATEHDLVEHCRAHLASYKKPRAVRFVASLPRSHYGKVIRAELLAQVAS
ncbi:MAG: AMP-binding protein [Rhizobiales bacterium]|nr:AMP-binding protein [Hyphomicrobiales bacterium]